MTFVSRIFLLLLCFTTTISFAAEKQISFATFIKGKSLASGYFSFYHDKKQGKVYLQIDKFDQEFLFQSSLPQTKQVVKPNKIKMPPGSPIGG